MRTGTAVSYRLTAYDFSMNVAMAGSMQADCAVPEGMGQRHFYGVLECLGRATDHVRIDVDKLSAKTGKKGS